MPFPDWLPARPGVNLLASIVRTHMLEAPAAGAVRANTERFCTAEEGRGVFDLKFEAPRELCCVGLRPTEFVTLAPRKEA